MKAQVFGGLCLLTLSLMPYSATAITFGEPDCVDNASNTGCAHPNTVSLSGFRAPRPGENVDGVAFGRCSGSLLRKEDDFIVILTAGHCAAFYQASLQSGALIDVGVSFDALIERDIPNISASSWSPAQYILGGIAILPEEYGPHGLNAFNLQFDYAVMVFSKPADGWITHSGAPVDLSGIDPVVPSDEGLVESIVNVPNPPILTAVGYGTGEAHNKPGEVGNKGGAVNDLSKLGVRWTTTGTALINVMGQDQNLMMGSQNPARDYTGTCGGDSGGPIFYEGLQVAVTSSGDSICRGSAIMARLDIPTAQAFLQCALEAAQLEDFAACGCAEVNNKGICP